MSRFLSLLAVLFCFDLSLVAARLPSLHYRSPTPVDVAGLNTNAKRFGRGLPPLPPLIRRKPTGVDTARRSLTSPCAKSGLIQVINARNNAVLGYLQLYGKAISTINVANAAVFSSTVNTSGKTIGINILHVTNGNHYVAGLVRKNQPIGDGNGNVDASSVILGLSFATNPGDSPQADKDPSVRDRDAETAIWTYDRADDSLTATWVNYPGQIPSSTPAYIYKLSTHNKIFLTNSPTTTQLAVPVVFRFVSTGDQCPS